MQTELSPMFVIGSPRSGTSLLRLILTDHTKFIIPPECGFNLWLHNQFGDWSVQDTQSKERRRNYLVGKYSVRTSLSGDRITDFGQRQSTL